MNISILKEISIDYKVAENGNSILTRSESDTLNEVDIHTSKRLQLLEDVGEFNAFNAQIWASNHRKRHSYIKDLTSNEANKNLPYSIIFITGERVDNKHLCVVKSFDKKELAVLDLAKKEIDKIYPKAKIDGLISGFQLHEENYIFANRDDLSSVDMVNGKINWQIHYTDLLESDKASLIGLPFQYENKVFIFLSDFTKSLTICLGRNTGDVIQKISNFGGFFQLENGQIYAVHPHSLKILNPDSFDVRVIDYTAILEPKNWSMAWNHFAVSRNVLFFVHQGPGGGGTAIIGALSIDSPQLLWHTTIPIETGKYWVASIRAEHEKLYVLTQGGTLYVFGDGIYEAQTDTHFKI